MPKRVPLCPVCLKQNKKIKLRLRQINLTTGVYLCQNKSCIYPEGYKWLLEQRSLEEVEADRLNRCLKKKERKWKQNIDKICKTDVDINDVLSELNSIGTAGTEFNLDSLIENEVNKLEEFPNSFGCDLELDDIINSMEPELQNASSDLGASRNEEKSTNTIEILQDLQFFNLI